MRTNIVPEFVVVAEVRQKLVDIWPMQHDGRVELQDDFIDVFVLGDDLVQRLDVRRRIQLDFFSFFGCFRLDLLQIAFQIPLLVQGQASRIRSDPARQVFGMST